MRWSFSSERAPVTVIWADSDLHLKMSTKPLDLSSFVLRLSLSLSRSFVETMIKANKTDPDNCNWGACWKMHKLHAAYSILLYCGFISNGAIFGDNVKKIVSGLILMGIWQVGGFTGGAGELFQGLYNYYYCIVPCLWLYRTISEGDVICKCIIVRTKICYITGASERLRRMVPRAPPYFALHVRSLDPVAYFRQTLILYS